MWIDLMCPLQISPLRLHHWNIVEWQVVALWPKLRRCWRMAFKRRGRIQHSLRPLPLTHLKEKSRHLEPQRNDIGITWHDWAWGAWNLELQRRQSHRNWSSHQSSWHSSCAQSYGKWKIIVFLTHPLDACLKTMPWQGMKGRKDSQSWSPSSKLVHRFTSPISNLHRKKRITCSIYMYHPYSWPLAARSNGFKKLLPQQCVRSKSNISPQICPRIIPTNGWYLGL